MHPVSAAMNHLFSHPHFGVSAQFRAGGAEPLPVRILLRQPDEVASFGDTQILAETTIIEARVSQISTRPTAGDQFELADGTVLEVMGDAQRDSLRVLWTCEAREVSP